MSLEKTAKWRCDYCNMEVDQRNNDLLPEGWVRGNIEWNKYNWLAVDLCDGCFTNIFPRDGLVNHPKKNELKKPFWDWLRKPLASDTEQPKEPNETKV